MKTILAAALASFIFAAPVMAQDFTVSVDANKSSQYEDHRRDDDRSQEVGPRRDGYSTVSQRAQRINWQISRGQQFGQLNAYETQRLNRDLRRANWTYNMYRSDGHLTRQEIRDLDKRYDKLEYSLSYALNR